MELSGRNRRKKSLFRPWNSYLAKKAAVEASHAARQIENHKATLSNDDPAQLSPLIRLTLRLIDTYDGINAAYFQQNNLSPHQPPGLVGMGRATFAHPGAANLQQQQHEMPQGQGQHQQQDQNQQQEESPALRPAVLSFIPSPQSVKYCDENHDYIVRTGEMFNNRYMLEKVIGRGSFGQVVRAYDTRRNTHVAIKIIKNNAIYVDQALSEVRMTSYLNRIDPEDVHSIMRLRDKFIFRGHQCLVLELLSFSLYDLLRSTEFYGVSLNLVRKFCKQILSCLAFLARTDVNIVHCDLKPENVLLRHPQRSAIKVVDFGASCRISESMFTYVQSRFYRAPEVILGLAYETQVDVWSLGCMLIELHTGYPVFAGKDEGDQMAIIVERLGLPPKHMLDQGKKTSKYFERDVATGEWALRNGMDDGSSGRNLPGAKPINAFVDYHTGASNGRRKRVSGGHSEIDYEIFLNLANKMLQYDPAERITADEALRDAFVRGCSTRSGRESPPPMPPTMGTELVGEQLDKEVDSGRKAPVQRTKKVGLSSVVSIHSDASMGDLSEVEQVGEDVGGKLRLSKSEPMLEGRKKTFVFKTSEWAEEAGIEPPPWRAGGGWEWSAEGELCGVLRAGGGGRGGVRELKLVTEGMGHGCGREREAVGRQRHRNGKEKKRVGRNASGGGGAVGVVLPRGHGNVMLLYV